MNPLITILAHRGVEEIVQRHMPLWKGHGWPIQIMTPVGHSLDKDFGVSCVETGPVGHSGEGVDERVRIQMNYLSEQVGHSHHLIFEYDSFFLKSPALHRGCFGIIFENLEAPRFSSLIYPNPPWMIDSKSLKSMNETAKKWPALHEGGYMDRVIAAVANLSSVPLIHYSPPGFSRGTIEDSDDLSLSESIRKGAFVFHGVKTKRALDFILSEYGKVNQG